MVPTTYEHRGHKTLVALFILRLIPSFFILIALLIVASYKSIINEDVFAFIMRTGFGFLALITGISLLIVLIEYFSVSFSIEENSFRLKDGIINIREQSISFRQIQNIDISRPLLYRFMGMSRVIILTAGNEDNDRPTEIENDNESELIIDLIEKAKAEQLQHELLERAHIQVVTNTPLPAIDLHTN
jgi:uncharacterized membrane protein YdbT with pleckstrin-like domain